jgi:hypothetical protein
MQFIELIDPEIKKGTTTQIVLKLTPTKNFLNYEKLTVFMADDHPLSSKHMTIL